MRLRLELWLAATALTLGTLQAHAQALPTAYANIQLSGFVGVSGNYTGVGLARNGDITAGIDIGIKPFAGFYPVLEGRGMYPVAKGSTATQENLLGGLRLGRRKDRFAGYGDVLFGRGRLDYPNGYPNAAGTFIVLSNTSSVLSFGGGVDWDWTRHFGLKADVQLQRYQTPVTTTGNVFSKVFTLGVIYRYGAGSVR